MQKAPSRRPFAALLVCLIAGLAAACNDSPPEPTPTLAAAVATRTAVPVTPTPVPPTPTATPDPAVVLDGGVELIHRAYDLILALHIAKPSPAPLLAAAWSGASAEAAAQGVQTGDITPGLGGDTPEAVWDSFHAAYVALAGRVADDKLAAVRFAAQAAMARSLGDCHTFFLQPSLTADLEETRGGHGGVGVGIELAPLTPVVIREVLPNSPAEREGVVVGDRVVAVDGEDVSAAGSDVVIDRMFGEEGSDVVLTLRRLSGETKDFTLTRALVRIEPVESKVVDGFGYIRIRSFSTGTDVRDLVAKALRSFEAAGLAGWVLDLRDNPGGYRDLTLYSYFVGAGVLERTLLRDNGIELQHAVGGAFPERPLAVLINGSTGSVAEIFTAMVQDYGRARVFGVTSRGCAGFVHVEPLPDGSTLGVTIARSLTPLSEQPLYATGVIPDEAVAQSLDDLAAGRDPVLERALGWLAGQ